MLNIIKTLAFFTFFPGLIYGICLSVYFTPCIFGFKIKEDFSSSFILFQYFTTLKRRYNSFPTETSAL